MICHNCFNLGAIDFSDILYWIDSIENSSVADDEYTRILEIMNMIKFKNHDPGSTISIKTGVVIMAAGLMLLFSLY